MGIQREEAGSLDGTKACPTGQYIFNKRLLNLKFKKIVKYRKNFTLQILLKIKCFELSKGFSINQNFPNKFNEKSYFETNPFFVTFYN